MWILIAFVAAIGLTALAIMAVFGEFGSASSSQSAQSTVTGVSAIISNTLTNYAGNPNFSGISITTVIDDGAVPGSWTPGGETTAIDLPNGGSISTIAAVAPGTGAADTGFAITLDNLNRNTCAQFGTFYTPNVSAISVNGTAANNPDYNGGTASPSWPPSLASDCKAGSNSVVITVAGQ